jgi:hypothetical protein
MPGPSREEYEEYRRRNRMDEPQPDRYEHYFEASRNRTRGAGAAPPVGRIPGTLVPAAGGLGTVPWMEPFQVWSNIDGTHAGLSREDIDRYLDSNRPKWDAQGRTFLLRWTPFPTGTGKPGTLDAWGRHIPVPGTEDLFPEGFFEQDYNVPAGEEAIRRWYEPFYPDSDSGDGAPLRGTGARRHPQKGCLGR